MSGSTRARERKNISLQTTLVIIIVVVSAIGLMGASFAVTYVMHRVLVERVDEDLSSAVDGWTQNPDVYESNITGPPSEFTVLRITNDGRQSLYNARTTTQPDFTEVKQLNARPVTVHSRPGSDQNLEWRTVGVTTNNGVTFVAKSMEREDLMIRGLTGVQILISLIGLVLMALVGSWSIRRSLRPLREVESTARAIAGGDLDRRIPAWSLNTEVGRLAQALNVMLAQLQESIETAQSKEEQMRRFIGDASHELRTPLTSLRGYTELYRSGATKDVDLVFDKIDEESGRMKLLVEDLLSLTRAEGQRLDKRTVDMLELVLSAASSARAAFPEREITVHNNADDVPLVNGDPDRLHQVLMNLVTNGLRHGGDTASVELCIEFAGDNVAVKVADDGKGMSQEVASHIFERFYREDTSRTRGAGGGSGLGLAIVKSLVEQHSGTVTVESQPGVGTTFTILLPSVQ